MSILPTAKTAKKNDFGLMKTMIYSNPKVGKSTFCSQIPDAVFAATEDGLSYLEVAYVRVEDWNTMLQMCKDLCTESHTFKTMVVDVVDLAYSACEAYICKREGVTKISDIPFGGGYKMCRQEFIRVMNKVNMQGIGLIFTSHSKVKEVKKKNQVYSVMDTSLSGSASEAICGFVDHIFYAYIDDDGKRLMRTKPTKYINAGDRSGKLPELMPFDYTIFKKEFDLAVGNTDSKTSETKTKIKG